MVKEMSALVPPSAKTPVQQVSLQYQLSSQTGPAAKLVLLVESYGPRKDLPGRVHREDLP